MTDFLYVENNYFTKPLIYKACRISAMPLKDKVMFVLGLIMMYSAWMLLYILTGKYGIGMIISAIIIFFLIILCNVLITKIILKKISKVPYYYDLKFNATNIEMIVEGKVVFKYVYNSFYAIKQTKNEYMLFTKAGNFMIIQKANLDTKQKEQFLKLVKEMKLIKLSRIN